VQSLISIFIICKNEERIIEKTLKQAKKLADEIVIVDSGSTDSTLEICKKYTDKIFHQDWLGFGKQKNIALEKCSHEWVLSLDADEILSNELIAEIKTLKLPVIASNKETSLNPDAFLIARKLFIGEKEIKHGGFYPDYQLRLFRKSKGRFCESPVHESVELQDSNGNYGKYRKNILRLKNPIQHFAYKDIDQLENSFMKYAHLSTRKKNIVKAIFSAIYVFVYKFFIRLGLLDGFTGLKLALINARYNFAKYS
jgi:glycosyltransferase involved in cell wall biosynthesis